MSYENRNDSKPFFNNDIIAKILLDIFKLSPFKLGVVIFFFDLLVDGYLGWHYGIFYSSSSVPGILQDKAALITDFFFNPLIAVIYLWITNESLELVRALKKIDFSTHNNKNSTSFSYWIFGVIFITSLSLAILQCSSYMGWLPWATISGYLQLKPEMSFFRMPFWFFAFYSICYIGYNVQITMLVMQKTFRKRPDLISPFHYDSCGGLASIARYTTIIALGLGVIGLLLSAYSIYENQRGALFATYPLLVAIAVYMIFAPIFLLWPFRSVHQTMKSLRDAELARVSYQFESLYNQLTLSPTSPLSNRFNKPVDYEAVLKEIELLEKLQGIIRRFPVWPFNAGNVQRFVGLIFAPLLPALISILIELISMIIIP